MPFAVLLSSNVEVQMMILIITGIFFCFFQKNIPVYQKTDTIYMRGKSDINSKIKNNIIAFKRNALVTLSGNYVVFQNY